MKKLIRKKTFGLRMLLVWLAHGKDFTLTETRNINATLLPIARHLSRLRKPLKSVQY